MEEDAIRLLKLVTVFITIRARSIEVDLRKGTEAGWPKRGNGPAIDERPLCHCLTTPALPIRITT